MANPDHLAKLREGVTEWNEWRNSNKDLEIDLSGADLSGGNLYGANFTGANLSYAKLTKAKLTQVKLAGANLFKSDLSGADISQANLFEANLMLANISGANLYKADLSDADLSGSDLSNTVLLFADLSGASLCNAHLSNANVTRLKYDRKLMDGKYLGVRGLESCYGNPLFKRDAQDQDYIDAYCGQARTKLQMRWLAIWRWFDYGRSIPRVAATAFVSMLLYGFIYMIPNLIKMPEHTTPVTPFYFSVVTFTTLGFGDITPKCCVGELIVISEVILGYITLGLLLAILANTVARRS